MSIFTSVKIIITVVQWSIWKINCTSSTRISSNVDECLKKLQTAITTFKTQELPKLDKNKQVSVTKILDDITASLDDISNKVIDPLKGGLTKENVSQVQDNLNLDISPGEKGKFGPKTLRKIEAFLLTKNLLTKNQSIEGKIGELNFQILSAQVTSLKKENQNLKNSYIFAFCIALLAILISVFKGRRSKANQTSIPNRRTRNNKANLFSVIKHIGAFSGTQLKQKSTDSEKEDRDETIANDNDNLMSRTISDQDYQQICSSIYQQIYHELDEKFNQRIGNLESQIFTAVNQRIEQELERKIKSYLPPRREARREPQTRIPTRQDRQQKLNQTPGVSTPQVSHFSTPQWINTYNNNPSSLSRNVTEVSETEESLSNRRIGSSQTVILAKKRRGNYWILTEGSYDYLVPSQNLRINQHNYKTVEALFECHHYHPDYSSDFQLLKPAVVYPLSGGQTWQLQEPGILQF